MKVSLIKAIVVTLSLLSASTVYAEPRTEVTSISSMRPYTTGTYFVTLATAAIADGSTCNRTYSVKSDDAGAKSVIATLLTAYALGQDVQLEVPTSTGCEGFGTPIQSVIVAQ